LAWRDWAATHCKNTFAADAWAALADARTERTAAMLLDQWHGAFDRAVDAIRQAVAQNDFEAARQQIDAILSRAELGRHLTTPWRVVLAGGVNVGKSSLLNALTGYVRSIVHATPGTTRDAVTAVTAIDGWPVELCDTAGLRADGNVDAVERAGMDRADESMAQADLVILVLDGNQAWSAEDQKLVDRCPEALRVHNKCDLPKSSAKRPAGIWTSAVRGDGIDDLLAAIARRLVPIAPPAGAAIPMTIEQVAAIRKIL
jgi:tRNA modification GTPase